MANVDDVAAAVLERAPGHTLDTFKLQKLVYYCQAWHLVWEGEEMFPNDIEAWAAGPVVYKLYDRHRGCYSVSEWPWGDVANLTLPELRTIDAVWNGYGAMTGRQLSHLTHSEDPWKDARAGLSPTARASRPISPQSMYAFYSVLDADDSAEPVDELARREGDNW